MGLFSAGKFNFDTDGFHWGRSIRSHVKGPDERIERKRNTRIFFHCSKAEKKLAKKKISIALKFSWISETANFRAGRKRWFCFSWFVRHCKQYSSFKQFWKLHLLLRASRIFTNNYQLRPLSFISNSEWTWRETRKSNIKRILLACILDRRVYIHLAWKLINECWKIENEMSTVKQLPERPMKIDWEIK